MTGCFLTGEAGIGKSTLLCHLHRQMAGLDGVVLLSPSEPLPCRRAMTLAQILQACETSLQLGAGTADPLKLARRLQRLSEDGCVPVLLADDADLLDTAALDALATLAGLRAGQQRLLSAVLAGTPALPARLTLPRGDDGMPENHRVVALHPLSDGAVARLLQRRLAKPFEPDAALAIAHVSGGVPAQVIEIGERALHLAARRSSAAVTGDIAAAALRHDPAPGQPSSGDPAPGQPSPSEPSLGEVMSDKPASSFEPHSAVVASFAADGPSRIAADRTSRIAFDETSPVITPFAAVRPSAESTLSEPIFPEPTLRTPTSADSQFPQSSLFPQADTFPQTGTFPPADTSREADESPFTVPPLDSHTGVRTTQRLTPTRRKSAKGGAGIGAKLAIVGGVCFAILLAVGSALYLNHEPADGTPDRSSFEAPSTTTSAPASTSAAATDRSAADAPFSATDDAASSTETAPSGGAGVPVLGRTVLL
ncbi:MAG: AAA family ATPase [Defluviicoccus sp.]|nr:MAG: AAA family ATPase [Defluviicoccus sp.]